jgi:uncharacterized protein YkwD
VLRAPTPSGFKLVAACAATLCLLAAAPAGASARGVERAVLAQVNHIRAAHGLHRLRFSGTLARAAYLHSADMSGHNFFSHASRNGTPWDRRLRGFVHRRRKIGETIAWMTGGHIAQRVVSAWMQSPPHRETLLDPAFTRIGIAGSSANGRTFVTADLSTRR